MPKKKIDLAKEAAAVSDDMEVDGLVTQEVLFEHCPKEFLADFKKAKTPAQRADLLYVVDTARLARAKEAEAIKKFVSKLEKWFIQELPESNATGVAGKIARVQIKPKERPEVFDWPALYAHIKKKGEFELLNRAPNAKSIKERWEAGKAVPGIKKQPYKDVSITKVK